MASFLQGIAMERRRLKESAAAAGVRLRDERRARESEKQRAEGIKRKLVGFEMTGRGIGRDGYEVRIDGAPSGWVTSGGPSPTLNKNIGLCYLPVEHAVRGQAIEVVVRNQPVAAVTVPTPFYKRPKT